MQEGFGHKLEMANDIHISGAKDSGLSSLTILSVRVHNITLDRVLTDIEKMIEQRSKCRIIPVNPEMIMTAQRNPAFRQAITGSAITLPDGIGIVVASRLLGSPIATRLTGIDTLERIAELAERRRFRIFLLGAQEGVAERAAARLKERYPSLMIVGTLAGSPRREDEALIRSSVNKAHPDILFIAYGAPKQELWLDRNHGYLDVPIAMCVGGAFNFLAGESSRAPRIVQQMGIEWLYRLIREPWRWKRMLALPRFAYAVLIQSVSARA